MNVIAEILFQRIPGMLFEPFAILGVFGLILAAILYWKRHSPLYWVIGLGILFMLSWRLGIQIISSRYASILIYPVVIATAYFCFQTEWLVKYIPKIPAKWCKYVPYLFVIGLGAASLGKALHYNPYGDRLLLISKLILKDAQGRSNPHILAANHDFFRLMYYSGLPSTPIPYSDLPEKQYLENIGNSLKNGTMEPADHIYFVLYASTKKKKGYYLQKFSDKLKPHFQYLGEFYHNRKKRYVTRVYRFNMKEYYKFQFSLTHKDTENKNGKTPVSRITFDGTHPAGSLFYKNTFDYFSKQDYRKSPKLKDVPIGWSIQGTPGYISDINTELGTIKDSNGINTFYLKSQDLITTYTEKMYPAKQWRFSMKVSGTVNTVFNLAVHCYNAKYGWCSFLHLPTAKITENNRIYEYSVNIPDDFYTPETKFIRPTICLQNGELFVHSIELYEQ